IDQEKVSIHADLVALDFNCQNPNLQRYGRLWKDLGRLSHYVADLSSPFHANSFAEAQRTDDYHEGVLDAAGRDWVKGLWDRGYFGWYTHGTLEHDMGEAADI